MRSGRNAGEADCFQPASPASATRTRPGPPEAARHEKLLQPLGAAARPAQSQAPGHTQAMAAVGKPHHTSPPRRHVAQTGRHKKHRRQPGPVSKSPDRRRWIHHPIAAPNLAATTTTEPADTRPCTDRTSQRDGILEAPPGIEPEKHSLCRRGAPPGTPQDHIEEVLDQHRRRGVPVLPPPTGLLRLPSQPCVVLVASGAGLRAERHWHQPAELEIRAHATHVRHSLEPVSPLRPVRHRQVAAVLKKLHQFLQRRLHRNVPAAGVEPATSGSGDRRSIR